jgi:hypothetical protein
MLNMLVRKSLTPSFRRVSSRVRSCLVVMLKGALLASVKGVQVLGANPSVEAGVRKGLNWIIVNASPPQLGRSWKRWSHMSRLGGADHQARSSTNNSEKSINQRMALRHRTQAECKGRKVEPWQEPNFHLPTTTTGICCSI